MKKVDLERLEASIMEQLVRRRGTGGYSVEAEHLKALASRVLI